KEDAFTQKTIKKARLPRHREAALAKMAIALSSHIEGGVKSEEYQTQLTIITEAMQQGDILKSLKDLAIQPLPNFPQLIAEVSDLTARELADFSMYIYGRLNGIDALRTIIKDQNFKKGGNEKD